MRKVFANGMVAHVWAQQTQPEGHSANGNFYFVNSTIYSYGSHYPVARFTDARLSTGERVVLFNSTGSSVTTEGKHKNAVRHALRGLNVYVFDVPRVTEHERFGYANPADMHAANLAHYVARFEAHAAQMTKPHVKAWLGYDDNDQRIEDTAENRSASLGPYVVEMHRYADAFNITARPHLRLDERKQEIRDAWDRYHDPKAVAKRGRAAARRQAKRDAENAALYARAHAYIEGVGPRLDFTQDRDLYAASRALADQYREALYRDPEYKRHANRYNAGIVVTPDQWCAGAGDMTALGWSHPDTLLRRKGDRLETSRGAEVPWPHAVRAFFKAQECRRTGTTWHRNGERVPVGVFQVDSIDAEGNLRAGCHTLTWDEMQRLATREIPHMVRATFPVPALIAA